jgi:hypothetical protein
MLAIVSWQCDCGAHVKAMYETDGHTVVRCPTPSCKTKHLIDGNITQFWVEDTERRWTMHDVSELIVR